MSKDELFQETLGIYQPGNFLTKTHFTRDEIKKGRPGSSTYPEYWDIWSVVLHEWFHHLQIVASTFGGAYYKHAIMSGILLRSLIKEFFGKCDYAKGTRPCCNLSVKWL